jgi:N-acetylmuramoyl-L-alanine amidase
MFRFLIIVFLLSCNLLFSQTLRQCKQRFDAYLNFRGSLNNLVKFENNAVVFYNSKNQKEFTIYDDEVNMLAEFFENNSLTDQIKLLKQKGLKKYSKRQRDSIWINIEDTKNLPKKQTKLPLLGYKIALDAGHFGTNLNDAAIEQKYLYFAKDSLSKTGDSIKIFESSLTFNTTQLLEKMLTAKGATVFNSRDSANHTSYNCTYNYFFKYHKKRVLDSLRDKEIVSLERHEKLLNATPYKFFWDFFRDHDLANRAAKINGFNPHLTLIVHYNVEEKNKPWTHTTKRNFTMAFIGGAFTEETLNKVENRFHFLRLLLTSQLNYSEKLAKLTVANFNKKLQIQIASQQDADYLKDNCTSTKSSGVFCRNLILCRLINSPLVYGESLYQDNDKECLELMKTNLAFEGIATNERNLLVAKSYYEAIFSTLIDYK